MADNEVILDKDVRQITAVRLVPSLRGPWQVFYEVVFVDGRIQQRPMSAFACPNAIANFEGRYFASAHRDGLPGTRMPPPKDEDAKSESIDESLSHGDGSEADDRHLDNVLSDDSIWGTIVDSQGRSATSPTVRAAIRAKASAPDEIFRTPSKEGSESGDSTEHGSSSKSPGSATTAEHRSPTKSACSATSDSLLLELAATAGTADISPKKRPVRAAAFRGVVLRRYTTEQQLHALDDVDLFADDDDSDGVSPRKRMAKLTMKDEVVAKAEIEDDGMDPWGNQPATDPWTQPASAPAAAARDRDAKIADTFSRKTEKELGVVGSMFAEYFASQARNKDSSLASKQVKAENISDDDKNGHRGRTAPALGACRKRRLGQRASTKAKIEVITLSDDEDEIPRVPAKKSKKRTNAAAVYVLSSDSEDDLDQSKP